MLTQSQLLNTLKTLNRAMPITIVAEVDAHARKTNNPYWPIRKRSKVNGFVGYDYERAVNAQREREDKPTDFVAGDRVWGDRLTSYLTYKDSKWYLTLKVQKILETIYLDKKSNVLTLEQVKPYLPTPKKAWKQGLDKDVIHREYTLTNIHEIHFQGQNHLVMP